MRLKLDENLGQSVVKLFRDAHLDVSTTHEEGLCAASDHDLIVGAHSEGRCFVTLDLDFSNVLLFPPSEYSGIAVLRLPRKPVPADLSALCSTLVQAPAHNEISGRLWVVEIGRIREYEADEDDDEE